MVRYIGQKLRTKMQTSDVALCIQTLSVGMRRKDKNRLCKTTDKKKHPEWQENEEGIVPLKSVSGDFLGGPVVKNLPCNAGDESSIPDQGTKIPHATWRSLKTKKNYKKCMRRSRRPVRK